MFLMIVVSCVPGLGILLWYLNKRGGEKLQRFVADVNAKHGTNFAYDMNLIMGGGLGARLLYLDPTNKKIMFHCQGQYTLHDYSYIRGWSLHWTETNTAEGGLRNKDVHFKIKTNDVAQPIVIIPMVSKAVADSWNHRLDLLLNG